MISATEIHSWFIPTDLKQDEALSSWLIRAALDSGCDPLSLTGVLLAQMANLVCRCRSWFKCRASTGIDQYDKN